MENKDPAGVAHAQHPVGKAARGEAPGIGGCMIF